jgi:hypothetical protein
MATDFMRARSIVINVYSLKDYTLPFWFFLSIFREHFLVLFGKKTAMTITTHTRAGACGRGYNTREPLSDLFLSNRYKRKGKPDNITKWRHSFEPKKPLNEHLFLPHQMVAMFFHCVSAGRPLWKNQKWTWSIHFTKNIFFWFISVIAGRHMRVFIAGQITFQRRLSLPWHPPSSTHTIVWLIDDFPNRE